MDKSQAKKYTKIAVTLGVIAGGSALLIGLANIITAGPIAQHELEKKLESIKVVYGENAKYSDEVVIPEDKKEEYPSLISYFNAKSADDVELGNVFVTSGKNAYGEIKMAIGINADESMGTISLIINGQSFGSTLQEQYVDKFNNGEIGFDDVKCGATYGAKLVNSMGKEALSFYKYEIKGEEPPAPPVVEPFLSNIYGENAVYGEKVAIEKAKYPGLKEYYNAKDANDVELGNVFVAEGSNTYGAIKLSVGVNVDGKVSKIYLIENGQSFGEKLQDGYVDKFNKGEITLDDVNCGATFGATTVKELCQQAQSYYKNEIKGDTGVDYIDFCKEIFGTKVTYSEHHEVVDPANENLVEFWNAKNSSGEYFGRVYHAALPGEHAVLHLMVGTGLDGSLERLYLVNKAPNEYGEIAQKYVDDINFGTVSLDDEIKTGATGTCTGINQLAKQGVAHAKANPFYQDLLINVFDEKAKFVNHEKVNDAANSDVADSWIATDEFGMYVGRAYHCAQPGPHATLHVLVGTKLDGTLNKIYLVNKAPSQYGDIAQKYVDDLNSGNIGLDDDIKTGATGTCTGINQVVKEALAVNAKQPSINAVDPFLAKTFGTEAKYVDYAKVNDETNANVVESWEVKDGTDKVIGRTYHCALPGKHGVMHLLVGVKADGTLEKIVLVNKAPSQYGDIAEKYAEDLSTGKVGLDDEIKTGATGTCTGINQLTKQALANYAKNPIVVKGE